MESTMPQRRSPSLPCLFGIDLSYRPRSYFWPLGLKTHLLAHIKGAERRAALKPGVSRWKAGEKDGTPVVTKNVPYSCRFEQSAQ